MLPQPVITPSSFMTERSASALWPPQSPLPCLRTRTAVLCCTVPGWLAGNTTLPYRSEKKKPNNKPNQRSRACMAPQGDFPARGHFPEVGAEERLSASVHMGLLLEHSGGLARGEAAEWVMPCKHSSFLQKSCAELVSRAGTCCRVQHTPHSPSQHCHSQQPVLQKKSRIRLQAGALLEPPRVRPRSHGSHGFGVCLLCFAGLTWLHLQNAVMSEHPLSDQKGPVEV